MTPTIANKTINAIPTTGAVGAGVDNNPPRIKWLILISTKEYIFSEKIYSVCDKYQYLLFLFIFAAMNSGAERFNGLMAMLGIVAGVGAYATTGQFIPGIF